MDEGLNLRTATGVESPFLEMRGVYSVALFLKSICVFSIWCFRRRNPCFSRLSGSLCSARWMCFLRRWDSLFVLQRTVVWFAMQLPEFRSERAEGQHSLLTVYLQEVAFDLIRKCLVSKRHTQQHIARRKNSQETHHERVVRKRHEVVDTKVRPEKLQFFGGVLCGGHRGPAADAIPTQTPSKQSRRGSINEA